MLTSRRRRAGFTVLEMGAVIFILALFATGVVIRLDAASAGENGRALRQHLVRVARVAASEAAASGRTVEITFDAGARSFVARTLPPAFPAPGFPAAGLPAAGLPAAGAEPEATDFADNDAPASGRALATARLPAGWEPDAWESGGEITSADQWSSRFFADGTRDRAGVGFAGPANGAFAWIIPVRGEFETVEGGLPAPEPDTWPAGELEVRTVG